MKKIGITLVILTIICIAAGNYFWKEKIKSVTSQAVESNKTEKNTLTQNKSNSLIDWMKFKNQDRNELTIGALGSSVTLGSGASNKENNWLGMLTEYINSQVTPLSVHSVNKGFGGYTTSQLISEGKIEELIKTNPDIVLFELCLINNFSQGITIDQTTIDIDTIVQKIKTESPNTLVILQNANEINRSEKNKLGLTYKDYNTSIKKFVEQKDYNFYDIYNGYVKKIDEKNKNITEFLSDKIHPNDEGYKIWFEILKDDVSQGQLKI
ncbi:hypothetical protein BHL51_18660 [Bacillus cereus]|uniref:SGNH/GDSL hydrolase family protein n=1 Tax=Bacillus cereus TaxID=1396 RepID=UPI0009C62E49|nr:SGNH/GDSL hydrolase family protein [Bacillus cereus]OOZ97602.1 hypothetical protein BHL51_18660 [Bacillus cereus]